MLNNNNLFHITGIMPNVANEITISKFSFDETVEQVPVANRDIPTSSYCYDDLDLDELERRINANAAPVPKPVPKPVMTIPVSETATVPLPAPIQASRISLADALEVIETYHSDIAMHAMLYRRLRDIGIPVKEAKPTYRPCVPDPAAVQVTGYDNWPYGKQVPYKTNRYSMNVKAWGEDTSDVSAPDFEGLCNLMSADKLIEEVDGLLANKKLRNPISPEYADYLRNTVAPHAKEKDYLVGMIVSKPQGLGTIIHNHHVMLASIKDGAVEAAVLVVDQVGVALPRFDKRLANGRPLENPKAKTGGLKSRCLGQSRHSRNGNMPGWVTPSF